MEELKALSVPTVAISAFIGCIAYFYKTHAETRKSIRRVLYYLLEMRHALSFRYFDAEQLAEDFCQCALDRLNHRAGGLPLQEVPEDIRQVLSTHISALGESAKSEINEDLVKQLNESLNQLSQTHPVLAFRIRGLDKVEKTFMATDAYYRNVAIKHTDGIPDAIVGPALRQHARKLREAMLDDSIDTLDQNIFRVARASSTLDWIRCKYTIRKMKNATCDQVDKAEIAKVVDEMLIAIATAAQANKLSASDSAKQSLGDTSSVSEHKVSVPDVSRA